MGADAIFDRHGDAARVRSRARAAHPQGPSRRVRRAAAILTFVVVAVLAVGRFLTAGNGTAAIEPALATTPAQRLAALETRTDAHPDDVRAWQALASGYVQRLVRTNDPAFVDLAQRALARADALRPNDVATLVTRGTLQLNLHRFADARATGEAAVALAPADAAALGVLVDALVETGRYDDAAAALQRMLDHRPDLAALARVSYLRELHGDVDGALAAMREAITAASGADPYDRAGLRALQGDLLFNHGRVDDAAAAYDAALVEAPDLLSAGFGRARVLAARGERAAAVRVVAALNAQHPTMTGSALLGDLATFAGDAPTATAAYDLVRAMAQLSAASGAEVDLELAQFEVDHGTGAKAARELAEKAYAARPSVHAADVVAWARFRAGDLPGALAAVADATRLGSRDAIVRYHAAAIRSAAGDVGAARRDLADALRENPWLSFVHRDAIEELAARLGVALPAGWVS